MSIASILRRRRAARLAGRFARARSGATAVEFALIAAPFFFLLFAMIEIASVFFVQTVLENAVLETAREIRTGRLQGGGGGREQFAEAVCDRIAVVGNCERVDVDVRVFEDFGTVDGGSPLNNGEVDPGSLTFEPGDAGDIVLVRVFYEWPLLTPNLGIGLSNMNGNKRLITAATVFRNEPFDD